MGPLFELEVTTAARGSREVANHLHRQLSQAIREQRLPVGSRMPSTRDAPGAFGVSRNTAQEVYDHLAQEGLLVSRHGSGTYVQGLPPSERSKATAGPGVKLAVVNPFWERADVQSWIGFWHGRESESEAAAARIDLRPALVDHRLFPFAPFRRAMARQLRRLEARPASSRSPHRNQGSLQLRRAIAEHLGLTRAVACEAGDVLVTSGAQQAFDLIARTLVVPGETIVAIEDPGYPPLRVPFAAAGARLAPVRVDREGIVVEEIPPEAKIICVCPSHQFPLGMPLSPGRRRSLLRFAAANGAVVVEDDYDGEFRFEGSPVSALRDSGSSDRVFYVGSFSKSMFPAVRLGFVIAPAWALPSLVSAKNAMDWHCPVPIQAAVAGFIRDGHLARHIRRVRRIYSSRRDHLLGLLERRLADVLAVVPSFYGMHIAATALKSVDCDRVTDVLAQDGVMLHSLARYHLGEARHSGLVLGYAASSLSELDDAVAILERAIRDAS